MVSWAENHLDREARAQEHLTDDELHDRAVISWADSNILTDGWAYGHPDDAETRRFLIESECLPDDFADEVLAKMRELGAEGGLL
jgi:hypothetical protein